MTVEKVKQIIIASKILLGLKNRLIAILSNLNNYCLTALGLEISRKDSRLIALHLVNLWEKFAQLTNGLKKDDTVAINDFFKLLSEYDELMNDDDRLYLLNLVLDVRVLSSNKRVKLSPKQYEDLLNYEISLFWYLPKEEVIFFLQNELLFLEGKVNLLEYVKVVVWQNDWDFTKDFSQSFSEQVFKNTEILAGKTVNSWLKDYFDFSSTSSFRKDVVQVAEFLVKNPLVQKLSNSERKTLSEILKLYVWFLEPEISEDDVINFKEQVRVNEIQKFKVFFEKKEDLDDAIELSDLVRIPPVIPAPKDLPLKKPMEEVANPRIKNQESRIKENSTSPPPPVADRLKPDAMGQARITPERKGINDRRMDLEDKDVRPGLKMWNSTPPQMPKQPEAKNKDNTVDTSAQIDKKLEELEKRVKN